VIQLKVVRNAHTNHNVLYVKKVILYLIQIILLVLMKDGVKNAQILVLIAKIKVLGKILLSACIVTNVKKDLQECMMRN
jgi:hypothetical protein